jgi:MerR family transcriptional regulator, redox-sensitive transcriptional activator SoxR
VRPIRTNGNQRRFLRADIRRLSFALIAQRLGLSLAEIEAELATLPQSRSPTSQDWHRISVRIRNALEAKIEILQRTRDLLDGCIGCGCLSLDRCALYNPGDRAARAGAGPRFLLGNRPEDFGNVGARIQGRERKAKF